MPKVTIVLAVVSWIAVGCGGRAPGGTGGATLPGCSDGDGDGYGVGADCRGSDCNDFVAEIHTDTECDGWCEAHSEVPGCPCSTVEPAACYLGPPETQDIGLCATGLTRCIDGMWGSCDGEVLPAEEVCDDVDNDCDGEVDDGVRSECGTCGECDRRCYGPLEECGGWADGAGPGLVETPEGYLTLDGNAFALHVMWPSSSRTGEIFRFNTQTS